MPCDYCGDSGTYSPILGTKLADSLEHIVFFDE